MPDRPPEFITINVSFADSLAIAYGVNLLVHPDRPPQPLQDRSTCSDFSNRKALVFASLLTLIV